MSKLITSLFHMRKDIALLTILGFTFAGLLVDVRYEHRDVLGKVWESWIPLASSVVGVLACYLGASRMAKSRQAAGYLFLLGALTGLIGLYEHTSFRAYMFTRYILTIDPHLRGLDRPTWAPMAFTTLSALGFALVWPSFHWPRADEVPGS